MTDEGMRGDPMTSIEVAAAMMNFASSAWILFNGLKDEGFTDSQALKLVASFAHGAAGGKLES